MSRAVTAVAALLAFAAMPASAQNTPLYTPLFNRLDPDLFGDGKGSVQAILVNKTNTAIKNIEYRGTDGYFHPLPLGPLPKPLAPGQTHSWFMRSVFCISELRIEFEQAAPIEGQVNICKGPVNVVSR